MLMMMMIDLVSFQSFLVGMFVFPSIIDSPLYVWAAKSLSTFFFFFSTLISFVDVFCGRWLRTLSRFLSPSLFYVVGFGFGFGFFFRDDVFVL